MKLTNAQYLALASQFVGNSVAAAIVDDAAWVLSISYPSPDSYDSSWTLRQLHIDDVRGFSYGSMISLDEEPSSGCWKHNPQAVRFALALASQDAENPQLANLLAMVGEEPAIQEK